jgi:hypothetical protein
MRLIGKDRCLVILNDGPYFKLYMDHVNQLAHIIDADRPLKRFHRERIGDHCLFALDETKRLFVMLSMESVSFFLESLPC